MGKLLNRLMADLLNNEGILVLYEPRDGASAAAQFINREEGTTSGPDVDVEESSLI